MGQVKSNEERSEWLKVRVTFTLKHPLFVKCFQSFPIHHSLDDGFLLLSLYVHTGWKIQQRHIAGVTILFEFRIKIVFFYFLLTLSISVNQPMQLKLKNHWLVWNSESGIKWEKRVFIQKREREREFFKSYTKLTPYKIHLSRP